MSTFILVHGAWHGSWCWEKVAPLLAASGHRVALVDFARSPSPSLASYRDAVLAALDAAGEPAVVVGHSMGGIVISEAAEAKPDRIAKLVYVTGFLPRSGESMFDLARTDRESLLRKTLVVDEQGMSSHPPDAARAGLFADCSDADADRALARLVKEPIAVLATPATLGAKFARVPRAYVVCTEDRAVSPSLQRRMIEASPCDDVVELAASHSPFFSKPDELASILLRFA
jgi:pimeloyl-ACP methyl ester carboxylesterase